jgi:cytochrome c biogenesis protein
MAQFLRPPRPAGTVIEQGASPAQYMQDYPLEHPVLGVLTWQVILGLGLDHVYTNPAFLALLLLLAACLSACTSTRQLPMLRVARR